MSHVRSIRIRQTGKKKRDKEREKERERGGRGRKRNGVFVDAVGAREILMQRSRCIA